MKKILTLLLFHCIIPSAFAQKSFEGEVVYSIDFISRNPKISNKQFRNMFGDSMHYYMKGSNYKSTFNGTFSQWEIYINKDRKIYNKVAPKDTALWHDVTYNHDTIYKIELKKNDTSILGYKCNKLIFICKSGIQIYYYNSRFFVDPKLYINHQEGNWYAYLEKAKAIALKEVMQRKSYIFILTATSVSAKKLEDNIFTLPPHLPVRPSTSKL